MIPAHLPLSGIRVVEFSTMITASLATMMFAQQGAEVIKVEPPGIGDPMRWLGSMKAGISGLFHGCNRAKQSVTLDLKNPGDVAKARALCLKADIVIHNYRPGVMKRLGLDSVSLRAEKPELIYCSITGFGRDGPLADRPAYDHVIQALSGLMSLQGGDEPAFVRTLICDKITAYTAAQAVTAALFHRERTGKGQHLDLSMLASCIAFIWPDGGMHLALEGEDVAHGPPFREFYGSPVRTRDGAVAIAAMTDAHYRELFTAMGMPELNEDERFNSLAGRASNLPALLKLMTESEVDRTSEELLADLATRDVPACPCLPVDQLADHAQIVAIEAMERCDHPHLGPVLNARHAPIFAGQRNRCDAPSPLLGEHNEVVLAGLDLE